MATISTTEDQIPTREYKKAFCEWAKCKPSELKTRRMDGHAVILYDGITYIVSHFNDFKSDFRSYFENESYDEISGMISPAVWELMLQDCVSIAPDELIVSIYRGWHTYWSFSKNRKDLDRDHIEKLQERDYKDLMILIETIKINPVNVVKHANNLGTDLISPIALAIKDKYESFDDFLDDAVGIYTEYGKDFVAYGDTWEEVLLSGVDTAKDELGELFYIYNPMWDFEDMEGE